MQPLDPAGVYSPAAVKAELLFGGGDREMHFRYDRLSSTNTYLGPLTNVLSCNVDNNYLADIKRSANFTLVDDGTINFGKDRIKPYARLFMPDGGWVEWALGVFLLSTPARTLVSGMYVSRDVEAYDQLLVLRDAAPIDRYSIAAGVAYTDAIAAAVALAGITATNITASASTLPSATEWDPGTSYLRIVNDLLGAINYESAAFDEAGTFVAKPYILPSSRASDFTYATDSQSVIAGDILDTLDLYSVPNQFVLVKSEADQPPLRGLWVNTNPASPTSTVSRGRTLSITIPETDAPDQATIDLKAQRAAFEASQVYEVVEFKTALMPMHGNADVLTFTAAGLSLDTKFTEHEWSFELLAGSLMSHKIRKVVGV